MLLFHRPPSVGDRRGRRKKTARDAPPDDVVDGAAAKARGVQRAHVDEAVVPESERHGTHIR